MKIVIDTNHQTIDSKMLSPKSEQPLTRGQLRDQLSGSNTEYLSGILRSSGHMTIEEIRAERRTKYERVD